ncbi:ferredoxin [Streptomyces gardneri]|uniref:Ferredoxin n=1 Tax=Streptomyces gardneri TaxID=66892 RepID=A0A4Y3RIQ8_9ACTN|nr:ferredoxin [Streptomyces gardneri]GEB55730.1 ferredoxin [Streptomyces gardneri]GHH18963.1 ferredoxin [Streptomyces gardneri]
MSAPLLSVDRERCIGAGMCAMTAPDVFDQDPDEGLVLLLDAEPPVAHRAAARMAAGVCPSGAIILHEPESGGA